MSEDTKLVRQWNLLRCLANRRYGMTVKQMMDETGADDKTVRRDLKDFKNAHFPLVEKIGEFGRKTFRLERLGAEGALSFAFDEALALYLSERFLEPLAGTLFWQSAHRAFRKLRSCLTENTLQYIDRMAGHFHRTSVGASDYSKKAELIDRLTIGIEDSKVVDVTYQSGQATEPTTRDVYPYGFTYHRGSLYLVGRCVRSQVVKHYKIDRIDDVAITDVPFQRPDDFDLRGHYDGSFGVYQVDGATIHVKVRFSPTVARYVQEGVWHPSQRLTKTPDGSLLAEFDLTTTVELERWLLSFGPHAEALEPPALRSTLAQELETALSMYTNKERSHAKQK